jgi:hypothetical protein
VVPDWAFSGNVILLVGWNFLDVNLKGSTSLIIFYICFATAHERTVNLILVLNKLASVIKNRTTFFQVIPVYRKACVR